MKNRKEIKLALGNECIWNKDVFLCAFGVFCCYFYSYVVVYLARLSNAEIPWSLEQNCISRAFYSNFPCRLRLSQTWSQFTFLFILSHFFLAFFALRCAYSCWSLFLIGCKAISYIKRTIKYPEIPITLIHLKSN